jgi:carbon-monoxide dehydrogenase medium subunit
MKPAPFDYARAGSIAEAVALLAENESARPLAGGQSLGPMLNLRLARPSKLIDIKRIPELRAISKNDGTLRIGACITHAEIEDAATGDTLEHILRSVARGIAYRAVRNRGTLGGSLAHADPAADWITAMVALDARFIVHSPNTERRIAADQFMSGAYVTDLQAAELLTAIELPRLSPSARWAYFKICRKTGEFAKALGAAVHDATTGLARVVCGALHGPPVLLPQTARHLAESGSAAATAIVTDEIAALLQHLDPIARQLQVIATRRALAQLA